MFFAWDPKNKSVAIVGNKHRVRIYNRTGNLLTEFPLASTGDVIAFDWDYEGEFLAILQSRTNIATLYDYSTKKISKLNTEFKKPTFLAWGKTCPILAIGSSKGSLLLYNKLTFRKISIMGKHSKDILFGMWNINDKLALIGKDKLLTISDVNGETENEIQLKTVPKDLQFAKQMSDTKSHANTNVDAISGNITKTMVEDTITMNMEGKTVYMHFLNKPDMPVELAFQNKYGEIVCYTWYGDGYLLAGFSFGFVVSLSSHEKEMGEELNSIRIDHRTIESICVSDKAQLFAVATINFVKIVDLVTWNEITDLMIEFNLDYGIPNKLQFTNDGQILTIATKSGSLMSYLMSAKSLIANYQTSVCFLSSLQQISVCNVLVGNSMKWIIDVPVEPKILGVGPKHVCIGFNNHIWCYVLKKSNHNADNHNKNHNNNNKNKQHNSSSNSSVAEKRLPYELVLQQNYIGEINQILINNTHVVALVCGKCYINNINDANSMIAFPSSSTNVGQNCQINCVALTKMFIICGTQDGNVQQVYLKDLKLVNEVGHTSAIKQVFPNLNGTMYEALGFTIFFDTINCCLVFFFDSYRIIFVDANNSGYLLNSITNVKLAIDRFPSRSAQVFWDGAMSNVFYVFSTDKKVMHTYVYSPQTIKGPTIDYVDATTLKSKHFVPIVKFAF